MKKIVSLFLSFVILFCICGCAKSGNDSSEIASADIKAKTNGKSHLALLYSSGDTFNPYNLTSDVNRQICQLIFEPLVVLDESFNPIMNIASTAEVNGNQCTVNLKSILFSDSSVLTADDVIYSFKLAKASENFSAKLSTVLTANAVGSSTVVFTLQKADPFAVNLLTFPIIKSGSDRIADSDGVYYPPVGCGQFMPSEKRDSLVLNPFSVNNSGNISEIKLINAPDKESVSHYAQIGAADMYYSDISDGTIVRMTGNKKEINLNNLVYIGVNNNNSQLFDSVIRQAISSAIDRTKICSEAYFNNAVAANGFFHPAWSPVKKVQNLEITSNEEITIENLEKIGYNNLNGNSVRCNASGGALSFTVLVNSENRPRCNVANLVAANLRSVGIGAVVIEKNYADYLYCLSSGNFDLFIGEVKITDNMDLSQMLVPGGSCAYGLRTLPVEQSLDAAGNPIQLTADCGQLLSAYYTGSVSLNDLAVALQSQMPFIPLCYRTGVLFYNSKIQNVDNCTETDIYYSIGSYVYNK